MTALVASELLKLRTTRTFWALAGSTFGLILLIVVLSLILDDGLKTSEDSARSLLTTGTLSGLLMLVLGAVVGAGEYRHGTIASTLLVTPNRLRAVSAQTLACGVGGLFVGFVSCVLVVAIALPWLSARDAIVPDTGDALRVVLGGTIYAALGAMLGVALGAATRNQVVAIVTLLVFLFVVDPALSALGEDYARFSLTGLGIAMSGGGEYEAGFDVLPLGLAALVWAAYTALIVFAAAYLTARRDV